MIAETIRAKNYHEMQSLHAPLSLAITCMSTISCIVTKGIIYWESVSRASCIGSQAGYKTVIAPFTRLLRIIRGE